MREDGDDRIAGQFEQARPYLRSVAYGMLGSLGEAEDAVQEAWLRLARSDGSTIEDLRGWLTTVVGRICLDVLRGRRARPVQYAGTPLPEPFVRAEPADGPEQQAVLADTLGMALLVVLDTLSPAERLAFVLHDVFGVPFEEVAPVVGRTPDAARQLASRARRRVQHAPQPDGDLPRQRRVVDAFLAAARAGDFDALLTVLDPEVVFRLDAGPGSPLTIGPVVGAEPVARRMLTAAPSLIARLRPVIVNGGAGTVVGSLEDPGGVAAFTIVGDRIVEVDIVADPDKLRRVPADG